MASCLWENPVTSAFVKMCTITHLDRQQFDILSMQKIISD